MYVSVCGVCRHKNAFVCLRGISWKLATDLHTYTHTHTDDHCNCHTSNKKCLPGISNSFAWHWYLHQVATSLVYYNIWQQFSVFFFCDTKWQKKKTQIEKEKNRRKTRKIILWHVNDKKYKLIWHRMRCQLNRLPQAILWKRVKKI